MAKIKYEVETLWNVDDMTIEIRRREDGLYSTIIYCAEGVIDKRSKVSKIEAYEFATGYYIAVG